MSPTKRFFFLFCLIIVHLSWNSAFAQEKQKSPETIIDLRAAIEKILLETDTPAAGIALVNADSTIWVTGLGKANVEKNIVANENTMFRIGSISKMFVSLAILRLQEEGKISLKDKVHNLAPEIKFINAWEKTTPVLVEHLLEHTTGWDDLHLTEYALNDPKLTLKQGLDFHPHSRTSRWMPGSRMSYSNSGPPVAAYIIEKITGKKFEDYIEKEFFRPMGMENATYFSTNTYKQLGALLYIDKKPQPYWNIIQRPSGAVNASAKDMAKMVRFFLNRGRVDSLQLISESSLMRMETPSTSTGARAGLEYGYGLSNYSTPYKSFVYRSHNGGVNGGLSDLSYLPNEGVGYIVMINSSNGGALNSISQLIREFQTKPFKSDPVVRKKNVSISKNDLNGYYIAINPRMQVTYYLERIMNVKHLWGNKDFLFMSELLGGQTQTYKAINDQQYMTEATGKISLVRVKDPLEGDVVQAGDQVFLRVSPVIIFGQLVIGILWLFSIVVCVIVGVIWLLRYWRGKDFNKNNLRLAVWPIIASLLVITTQVFVGIGSNDPFKHLGNMSFISVSIMVATILFAAVSVWSIVLLIRLRDLPVKTTAYRQITFVAVLHLIATCYFLAYGVIGIRMWG